MKTWRTYVLLISTIEFPILVITYPYIEIWSRFLSLLMDSADFKQSSELWFENVKCIPSNRFELIYELITETFNEMTFLTLSSFNAITLWCFRTSCCITCEYFISEVSSVQYDIQTFLFCMFLILCIVTVTGPLVDLFLISRRSTVYLPPSTSYWQNAGKSAFFRKR